MDEMLSIVFEFVATLLFACIIVLVKRGYSYIDSKLSAKDREELERFVAVLVAAAEQMYGDEDGYVRLSYVQQMLIEEGYELTDSIRALIESKVFEINLCDGGGKNES